MMLDDWDEVVESSVEDSMVAVCHHYVKISEICDHCGRCEDCCVCDRDGIVAAIERERVRQDQKWGEQNHDPLYWMGILVEEVGEAAKNCIEGNIEAYREEMIQVAAVVMAALECLGRNGEPGE